MATNKDYGDWDSLVAAVEQELSKVLFYDVAPVAEEILRRHIKTDIYDKDKRKPYGWHGGMYPRRNILPGTVYSELEDNETLMVSTMGTPNTPVVLNRGYTVDGSEGGFLRLLEEGPWGIWGNGFPRPAVTLAQKEIDSSSKINAAIQRGIKNRIG